MLLSVNIFLLPTVVQLILPSLTIFCNCLYEQLSRFAAACIVIRGLVSALSTRRERRVFISLISAFICLNSLFNSSCVIAFTFINSNNFYVRDIAIIFAVATKYCCTYCATAILLPLHLPYRGQNYTMPNWYANIFSEIMLTH